MLKLTVLRINQKGVVHLLLPILLLAGIIVGVYLITNGSPLKLFSKASNPPIVFKKVDGSALPTNSSSIPQTTSSTIKIELTSTLGPPVGIGSTASISSPITTGTVSYRLAENPTDLNNALYQAYTQEPTVISSYTFKDSSSGAKFIWVDFKDSTGKTDRRSAQIEIVASISNLSAILTSASAVFNFAYTGSKSDFEVDMSTKSDMSWDVYLNFGSGSSSPVTVNSPHDKWDKYNCGSTLYWKVRSPDGKIQSPIQTATVNCPAGGGPTVGTFSGLSATLVQTKATFNFTPSSVLPGPFRIDMSTKSDMSWDVYQTFGSGAGSPVVVDNPTVRWDKYSCGTTLYWRALDYSRRNQSAIQSATISCPTPTPTSLRVFVTSTTYTGNLGGLSGADQKCQDRANAANLGGTWKAWLSDGSTSVADRLTHQAGPYMTISGVYVSDKIVDNWSDLTDGSIRKPINIDELGKPASATIAWTNSTYTGGKIGTATNSHCNNWTTGSTDVDGRVGSIDWSKLDQSWTDSGGSGCDVPEALYCFEQTALTSVSRVTSQRVTTQTIKVNVCSACTADINKSGKVDTGDWSYLLSCYNKKAADKNRNGQSCATADIDGNGLVNGSDFTCLTSKYGQKCN